MAFMPSSLHASLSVHIPVLLEEAIRCLDPKPNENFVDCTLGAGGHALEILKRTAPRGMVLGIDWDAASLEMLKARILDQEPSERLVLANDNFVNIDAIAAQKGFGPIHGVLFDLGYSSWQLEKGGRGLSFTRDEPLDMRLSIGRMVNGERRTAAEIVNAESVEELEWILREYGGERYARRIAGRIIEARRQKRIVSTKELVDIVTATVPKKHFSKIHPATKTFQALRIAVNDELINLTEALIGALKVLEPGGRIVIISFHSLEDRIVKNFFRDKQRAGEVTVLTKKPTRPSREEIVKNPRSRSARLRAAIKT